MVNYELLRLSKPRRMRCDLCDHTENVESRLDFFQDGQIAGDLHLCDECLCVLGSVLREPGEEILWSADFTNGGE